MISWQLTQQSLPEQSRKLGIIFSQKSSSITYAIPLPSPEGSVFDSGVVHRSQILFGPVGSPVRGSHPGIGMKAGRRSSANDIANCGAAAERSRAGNPGDL